MPRYVTINSDLFDCGMKPRDIAVLGAILSYQGRPAPMDSIADGLGMAITTVSKAIKNLIEGGLVKRIPQRGPGGQGFGASKYEVADWVTGEGGK